MVFRMLPRLRWILESWAKSSPPMTSKRASWPTVRESQPSRRSPGISRLAALGDTTSGAGRGLWACLVRLQVAERAKLRADLLRDLCSRRGGPRGLGSMPFEQLGQPLRELRHGFAQIVMLARVGFEIEKNKQSSSWLSGNNWPLSGRRNPNPRSRHSIASSGSPSSDSGLDGSECSLSSNPTQSFAGIERDLDSIGLDIEAGTGAADAVHRGPNVDQTLRTRQ